MSGDDTVTTDDEKPAGGGGKKGKHAKTEPYAPAATPVVNDEALYEFLLALFWDEPEPEQFPEHVELNIVSGRYSSKIEQTIWSKKFAPVRAEEYAVKHGAGAAKPTREQLVALSNLLLAKMRRDCDESGHSRAYAVMAWSTSRSDSPYMSFAKKMTPSGRYAQKKGESGEDDDDGISQEKKFVIQLYQQQQKMIEMHYEMTAGFLDRMQRVEERNEIEIDKLRKDRHSMAEQLERALSLEQDREERRAAFRQKRDIIDKGMLAVETYGPMLAQSLMGGKKDIVNGTAVPSDEVEALRNFLRTTQEGGQLTQEQLIEAFGDWDEKTGRIVTPGILAPEQVLVIVLVSRAQVPPDELDKLMPGGPLAVTMPQFGQLMRVFGEQIEQLKKIFEMRAQKRQQKET